MHEPIKIVTMRWVVGIALIWMLGCAVSYAAGWVDETFAIISGLSVFAYSGVVAGFSRYP